MALKQRQYIKFFLTKCTTEITEVPKILTQQHLPGLDGLRTIAVSIVLAGHAFIGHSWVKYFPGGIGVDIFFVISGFLITTLLLKEKVKNKRVSLPHFYIRRVLRIFPVAYLYLATVLFLTYLFKLNTTLRMFLTAGLYIGNFPIQYGSNWQTSHFWSLAVEEQFYIFFPFILVKWPNKYLIIVVVLLISTPFVVLVGELPNDFYRYHLIQKIVKSFTYLLGYGTTSILIGSVTSVLLFKKIIIVENLKKRRYLSLLVFVTALALHVNGLLSWNVILYIFPAMISYVILLNLTNDNFFSVFLNFKPVVKIGILSYSIYIWQELFTFDQPWKGCFKYSDSLLLNFVALLLVAYLSFTFFESKFLKLKRNFR